MTLNERRIVWTRIHRYLGLTTILFLALASATGSILVFGSRIDAALNPDLFQHPPGPSIPAAEAVAAFQQRNHHVQILSFPLNPGQGRNLPVDVKSTSAGSSVFQIFLDRRDGHLLGTRSIKPGWNRRQIVAGITAFHSSLLAGRWGRWLMGVVAIGWLIGVVVGIYLTFPRKAPFLANWKKMWTVRPSSAFGRLMLDLHRASGLWLSIAIIVMALTSIFLNFNDEIFVPVLNRLFPSPAGVLDRPAPFPDRMLPALDTRHIMALAQEKSLQAGVSGQPAAINYIPGQNLYSIAFTADGAVQYRGLGPVKILLDGSTGQFMGTIDPYRRGAGAAAERALYPLHSGQVGGSLTIAIIFLTGLSTLEMCVTGTYVWWKKRRSRVAGTKAAARRVAPTSSGVTTTP